MNSKAILSFASGEEKKINSSVHAFVASHPLIAVLVALAVGLVIGLLL